MALTTYSELQTSIANFLNREDLATAIPDFIALAEAQMQRELHHWKMEANVSVSMSGRYVTLPDDFRKAFRLYVRGANAALKPITQAEMQDKRMRTDDESGDACYYAIVAGTAELYPTQTSGWLELNYQQSIPVLSDSNPSNWLLAEAPDAYLYGALMQSAPYLQADERLPVWSALYTAAVQSLNMASEAAKYGGQKLSMRTR